MPKVGVGRVGMRHFMAIVYKYYPCNEYTWDALLKGYFFFNKVSKQNDPYDTSFKLIQSPNYIEKLINVGMHPNAREIMKDYGTCSFSKGKNNKNLWAFYAEKYSGMAIGFDEKDLMNLSQNLLVNIPYVEVVYVDELPDVEDVNATFQPQYICTDLKVKPIKFSDAIKSEKGNDHRKDREHLFVYLCSLKEKKTWLLEDETRLIAAKQVVDGKDMLEKKDVVYLENGYKIPFPEIAVKEIILGHNFNFEEMRIKELRDRYKNANFFITSSERPFDICIEPYYF